MKCGNLASCQNGSFGGGSGTCKKEERKEGFATQSERESSANRNYKLVLVATIALAFTLLDVSPSAQHVCLQQFDSLLASVAATAVAVAATATSVLSSRFCEWGTECTGRRAQSPAVRTEQNDAADLQNPLLAAAAASQKAHLPFQCRIGERE